MPWCDDCDRYLNPNSVRDDGSCPTCGSPIARPRRLERARRGRGSSADALAARAHHDGETGTDAASTDAEEQHPSTPWHFKVLLVALVIYLGWRLVQGIVWVAHAL